MIWSDLISFDVLSIRSTTLVAFPHVASRLGCQDETKKYISRVERFICVISVYGLFERSIGTAGAQYEDEVAM